jgi:hypothetical protein
MDIISLGKANQVLNKIKELDENIIAKLAESRFPTVDARLDWLEGQASKIKASNSKQVDLAQGTFTNTEVANGKLQLKIIGTAIGSGPNIATDPSKASAKDYWGDRVPSKSFDGPPTPGAPGGAWTSGTAVPSWIAYDFGTPKIINKLTLTGSYMTGAPKDFTFDGWDGVNWITLRTIQGEVWTSDNEIKVYDIENRNAYTKYRVYVTAVQGPNYSLAAIGQIQLHEATIANAYAPSGTWESPIVDLGEGYIQTTDIATQVSV